MDDVRRDKTKRSKNDHVKNIVQNYLHKRNYVSIGLENATIDQQITYSSLESDISRPNLILYSCYNNDPVVIEHSFSKFLSWTKDLVKNKNICQDVEQIVAPLFCHFYLDILKGGHSERASSFLKSHLPVIDRNKCDDFVKDLINLFATDSDATCMKEQFRSSKYYLELSKQSIAVLKKFVAENHVIFLHVFQTWFNLREVEEEEFEQEEMTAGACALDPVKVNGVSEDKFQELDDVIKKLESEPRQLFQVKISQCKETVTCAAITQDCFVYDQKSEVHLRPLHPYDSDSEEIRLICHSRRIYSISICPQNHFLISGSADSSLSIYDLNEIKLVKNCQGHLGPIYCTGISSSSAYAATGSQDTTARLWNLEDGAFLRIFVGHTQSVTCLDFHPNCLYLATGSADKCIRLWSINNGDPLRLFCGSKGIIYSLKISPLGDTLITTGDDKKLRLWEILSSKLLQEVKHKGETITRTCWSKDGRQFCTGGTDGVVKVWDLAAVQDSDKSHEPILSHNFHGKILSLEYLFETFACVTT